MDPDQTAPIGAVCSGTTLFASILNLSVMLGNYLQQTTSSEDIFRFIFFRVNLFYLLYNTFAYWVILHLLSSAGFSLLLFSIFAFQNQLFGEIISELPPECQTVLIQIRPVFLSGLIWVQSV